ncbi:hypothetical phage protein [Campylobacter phage CPt10]|uniref:DUF4376 domain-containing protein n=2 Tax=Firehammervirus CPt10 TaxID=722418 RepID=A0A410T7S5_9CAUD|nr:hypothetical protein APL46_gp198 [Campylobacter phage CPt10]QAU04870.1 hypothetical protein [Campylobacter phage CP20]CBJ94334.1 hypothetical phage protein [Campylobacter phage CPt10]
MFLSKENVLAKVNNLGIDVISFHIENKWQICKVDRELLFDEDGNLTNDITPEEIQAGTQAVKEYCLANNLMDLYYEYVLNTTSEYEKLNIIKEKKKFEIQTKRDVALESGFIFKGHTFQTREKDKLNINGMAANILLDIQSGTNSITEITWIDLNDEKVNFTPQEFLTFVSKVTEYTQEVIFKANTLKEKINSAETVKSVDKIKWE